MLNSKLKKDPFWGLKWKKEHQSRFCRSGHFRRSGVEKKRSNSVNKAFGTVLKWEKTFLSGNDRSGVLFLLDFAKLIDIGCGVEIFTSRSIGSSYIYIYMYIICRYDLYTSIYVYMAYGSYMCV